MCILRILVMGLRMLSSNLKCNGKITIVSQSRIIESNEIECLFQLGNMTRGFHENVLYILIMIGESKELFKSDISTQLRRERERERVSLK